MGNDRLYPIARAAFWAETGRRERDQLLERETGVEPATSTLARWRSTTELFPLGDAKDSERGAWNQGGRAVRRPYDAAAERSSIVPPQCEQVRIMFAPNFRSGAHSSQSGRSLS